MDNLKEGLMTKISMMILALVMSLNVFACLEDGTGGFLPENDMYISVDDKNAGGLTQEQFNAEIDKYEAIYAPVIANLGGKLSIARKWDDGTVNASAQRSGSTYQVNMFGGLARHPSITTDGFALVICHEIGHHIGGAPKIGGFPWINSWASNEGQSDYWATLKCLRQAFLNEDNAAVIGRMTIPATLSQKCSEIYSDETEKNICIRSGMAGASVSNLFAAMRNQPEAKFDTPDRSAVSRTNNAHPAFQCRLDTYFQGALCDMPMNEDVSQKDEVTGTCHGSTGQTIGLRPTCWFKASK